MSPVTLSVGKPCETCGSSTSKNNAVGYRRAFDEFDLDPRDFPILWQAVRNSQHAHNPAQEWVRAGHWARNYCEIFRTTFGYTNAELRTEHRDDDAALVRSSLIEHFKTVEEALTFGVPSLKGDSPRKCGGVWHFLERLPRNGDEVSLRILRDLTLKENIGPLDYDGVKHEWIGEISLLAARG